MRLLSSGPDDPMNGLVHDERPAFPTVVRESYVLPNGHNDTDNSPRVNVLGLVRRFWLLFLALTILGAGAGFASIILSSPRYKTLLLMEVQNSSTALPQNGVIPQGNAETSEVDIQTQVNILHSG